MASIQLIQQFTVNIDERTVKGGSLSRARSIAITDNELMDHTHKVAAETAVKVFDKTEMETLANFDFLWMESDLDVLVQFTADAGTTDPYFVMELKGSGKAGEPGPALVLGSDDSQVQDGAIDAFTGTADTIDEIWVYNEDDTDTARVRIVVAT